MSTNQEYWDACLIKTWRSYGNLHDALSMYYSITHTKIADHDPQLLRIPRPTMPRKIGMRNFVASYLPKVSNWLWDHGPDQDVVLLKKLSTSKCDTLAAACNPDTELAQEQRKVRLNRQRLELVNTNVHNRNDDTNWNKVKSNQKLRRLK